MVMSYQFYVVLHVAGVVLLFSALGAAAFANIQGIVASDNKARKQIAAMHGVAMLLLLVAGFGLMARTGISHGAMWPVWLLGKFAIWLFMGAVIMILTRVPGSGKALLIVLPLVGVLSVYLAKYKPLQSAPSSEVQATASTDDGGDEDGAEGGDGGGDGDAATENDSP